MKIQCRPVVAVGVIIAMMGCGKKANQHKDEVKAPETHASEDPSVRLANSCPAGQRLHCQQTATEIAAARVARDEALKKQDFSTAIERNLEINRKTEILDLYRTELGNGAELSAVDKRYEDLRTMVAKSDVDAAALDPSQCAPAEQQRCQSLKRGLEQKLRLRNRLTKEEMNSVQAVRLNLDINFGAMLFPLLKANGEEAQSTAAKIIEGRYETLATMVERLSANGNLTATVERPCSAAQAAQCDTLVDEVAKLRRDLESAVNRGDDKTSREIVWDINYKTELLETLREGFAPETEPYQAIVRKYDVLHNIWSVNGGMSSLKPYSERESLTVKRVYEDFGPLYIKESEIKLGPDGKPKLRPDGLPVRVMTVAEAKEPMPWAGYWYQTRTNLVSRFPQSPLAVTLRKFDKLSEALGEPVKTLDWEFQYETTQNLAPETIPEWEGICDAWAMAALLQPEPTQALELEGIRFSVSDLKGLLTKQYQNTDARYPMATVYGFRYDGNAISDGELQDPRPEAFHRVAEVMLNERHESFGIDSSPGPDVWNKPLFKMTWSIEPDPAIKNAYRVRAYPRMTRQTTTPTDLTTAELVRQNVAIEAPSYEYRLYVDPSQSQNGGLKVIYGEWLTPALDIHPDSIFIPDRTKVPKPTNKELEKGKKTLDALFKNGVPVP